MLVFFVIISIVLLILSKIGIKIEDVNISSDEKSNQGMKIYFLLYICNINIFSIKLNSNKIKKIYNKEKPKMKKIKRINNYSEIRNILLKKIRIKNILLNINIGTGNVLLTTYIIVILSTILSSILPLYIEDKIKDNYYAVSPIYENEISYKITVNGIMTIKTVHIIHIIYLILKKRRDEKYVRTSNRRAYESSYE